MLKYLFTTAPENFDGFETKTLKQTNTYDKKGRELRQVEMQDEHARWQTLRYQSGLHCTLDERTFIEWIQHGFISPDYKLKEVEDNAKPVSDTD